MNCRDTKDIKVARSRNAAFDLLTSDFFDLIVLDLNIPTIDDALYANPEHGHAVFARARSVAPGTPVCRPYRIARRRFHSRDVTATAAG